MKTRTKVIELKNKTLSDIKYRTQKIRDKYDIALEQKGTGVNLLLTTKNLGIEQLSAEK